MREKDSNLSAQEKAMHQQELLEQKRRAVAARNAEPAEPGEKKIRKELFSGKKKQKAETGGKVLRESGNSWAMREKKMEDEEVMEKYVSVSRWFLSICWMQIPVIGIIYVFIMAFSKKTPQAKKSFALAYLLYRALVLLLTVTILYVLFKVGVGFIDGILQYVK